MSTPPPSLPEAAPPLRCPRLLKPGDNVRLVACSGPLTQAQLLTGVDIVRAAGLVPVYDEGLLSQSHYLAGSDARRLAELQAAVDDPTVAAIWAARGGYGAARVVAQLETQRLAADPKWLIGFSDISALHCAWAQAGLCSLHAANISTLGSWSAAARRALFALLVAPAGRMCETAYVGKVLRAAREGQAHTGSNTQSPAAPLALASSQQQVQARAQSQSQIKLQAVKKSQAQTQISAQVKVTGRLLGGNLTVLASLCGTGLIPSWRQALVFLEDVGETPYRLDRCITQLRLSGAFDGAVGVVLGQLTDCRTPTEGFAAGYSAQQAILAALEPLGLPVLGDLEVGHAPQSQPLLLGARATLNLSTAQLQVQRD
jgi:muramoyltetrapeptide carboxypeptidase